MPLWSGAVCPGRVGDSVVELLMLGPIGVRTDDGVALIRSAKQRLIVAHLALARGQAVSEHVLVRDLWLDPPADPLHALQAHVSRLRRSSALPIEHGAAGYRLGSEHADVDASRFENLLRDAQQGSDSNATLRTLQEALAVWRGPALENIPTVSGLDHHRARLELLYDQAATQLIDAYLAVDRPEAALPLLREAVDLNPLDERRWGQLMLALDQAGRRSEALDAFSQARTVLVDQLGLDPSTRLQRIHRTILSGAESADAQPAVSASPPHELYGRSGDWAVLNRLLRAAVTHQRVAVISGEPGIGKTHLASQFVAAHGDIPVHSSRCHATHSVPYAALAQLIRSDCARLSPEQLAERLGSSAAALRSLVPDLVDRIQGSAPTAPAPPDPHTEHHRIRLALTDWLQNASAAGPVCLFIDDLQWADADSLRLIEELWSGSREPRVLWIVTLRDREYLPDSPQAQLIDRATQPSKSVVHLALQGLSPSAVESLLRAEMHEIDLDTGTTPSLDEIVSATAGNPLYVLAAARHLADQRALPPEEGGLNFPPSLTSIVESHLACLSASDRALLDMAAILGEEFDPFLAGVATGVREPHELDGFLAAAEHFRLVAPVDRGGMRHAFRHALVQAAVLRRIAPARRAQLHLSAARAAEHHPHVPDRLHMLAHHYAQAVHLVGADEVIPHLLAAATASLQQRAPAVALDLYQQAHEMLTPESPADQRCEVHLGLGEAGYRGGADYRAELLTAARLAHEAGDLDRLVRAAVANTRGWYSSTAAIDLERVAVIDAALSMLPEPADLGHRAERALLLSLWAMENVRDLAQRDEVLRRSAESLRIAETLEDPDLLGEIMNHRYTVLYTTWVDPAGTYDFARSIDAFASSRLDPDLQLRSAAAVAQAAMTMGDLPAADRALERAQRLATDLSHPSRLWLIGTWVATRMAMGGDVTSARAQATQMLELGTTLEQPDAFTWYMGQQFAFHHATAQLPALIDAVEAQAATLTEQIPAWRAAYALTLTAAERWGEARAIVDKFRAAAFTSLPVDVLYLHGLAYLADATIELRHADAAHDLYELLLPYAGMIASNATIDAGPVDLRLGSLVALCGDTAAARLHLRAAAALCHRNDLPLWLEHVTKAQARLG